MSNSSNSDWWKIFLFWAGVIILVMWLFDLGPFEKSSSVSPYPTSTQIHNGTGGYNPSFGSSRSYRTLRAVFWDGSYACEVRIYNDDPHNAYCNGSSQGSPIYTATYNSPGTHYCYWAHSAIYF